MVVKWFGKSWEAPVCDPELNTPVPVGKKCFLCKEEIKADDRGLVIPYLGEDIPATEEAEHLVCFMKELGLAFWAD